jgi:hydroxymethylglutaryl-CoA lyase
MADTPQILPRLRDMSESRGQGIHIPVLIPNMRGLDNLLKLEEKHSSGGSERLTDEISVFVPASDVRTLYTSGADPRTSVERIMELPFKLYYNLYRL